MGPLYKETTPIWWIKGPGCTYAHVHVKCFEIEMPYLHNLRKVIYGHADLLCFQASYPWGKQIAITPNLTK